MNWNQIEKTTTLPPGMDGMDITNNYFVVCKHEINSKRQTAIASYNHKTEEWTDVYGTKIKDVEYWIEKP